MQNNQGLTPSIAKKLLAAAAVRADDGVIRMSASTFVTLLRLEPSLIRYAKKSFEEGYRPFFNTHEINIRPW